jgi:quinol monooxygenase YgiN
MPLYQTGGYRVKPSAVNKVKEAIKEFVAYVETNEPGTQMYLAWQDKNDPTLFLHLFIFADEAAQTRHGQSEAVRRFESVYSPELVGGEVVFTDYELISGKPAPEHWRNGRPFSNPPGQCARNREQFPLHPERMWSIER